jgi:cysteine-S-conjugate beta-lyase
MKTITASDLADFGTSTRLVVGGREPADYHGFVNPPVYHGSTVLSPTVADLMGHTGRYAYGRRGSPTMDALEAGIRAIDGSAGVVLCPSGLSAVTTALLSVLASGDHLLMVDTAYGPTRHFCDGLLQHLGVETTYYDPLVGEGIEALIRPNTKVVYCESPGSLTFEVQDLPAIAAAAHRHGASVVVDNTWASPLYFDALGHGADIVVQAGTKYLVGHSDAMFGTVSANASHAGRLRACHGDLGLCAGPDDMFLATRGLRTLAVRMERHQASALALAAWLEQQPEVLRVLHPGLGSHPQHALWRRDFKGSSGLFAVVMRGGSQAAVAAFLDGLKLFGLGSSWGGFESLAIPFDATSARTATAYRAEGPTIRIHIGLEDVADLKADLSAGLARYRNASQPPPRDVP